MVTPFLMCFLLGYPPADARQRQEERTIKVELPTPREPSARANPRLDAGEIKGYVDFLKETRMDPVVSDPSAIVLDIYIGGLDPENTPVPPLSHLRPFNQSRGWDDGIKETWILANSRWGATEQGRSGGWIITPTKLYVGGLRFALLGELGIIGKGSNARYGGCGNVKVPIMNPNIDAVGGYDFIREDIGYQACSHFIISEAYWVYKAEKGSEVQYFAVEFNNMARTTMHCPFGPAYEDKMKVLRRSYPDGIFGRPMEERNILMDAGKTAMYGLPTRLGNDSMFIAREALKQMPRMVQIGTWEDVKRDYPTIREERFKLK
jgi:hypothetical protein